VSDIAATTDPSALKRTSCIRRAVIEPEAVCVEAPGTEGLVCAFEVLQTSKPLIVEDPSGRALTLLPGDVFLSTPGFRESTRFIVGGLPPDGLRPRSQYWILSPSGVVGELFGSAPIDQESLGEVTYLGALRGTNGQPIRIQDFTASVVAGAADHGVPVFVVVGTSADVGKTTAALSILRSLLRKGHVDVVSLKATGTSSIIELLLYRDYGAAHCFDCVDFGMPTTYPSEREGIGVLFERQLDVCLSIPADAVLIECGGDILGANVPVFLKRLVTRRADVKVVLVAPDALAAMGAKQVLEEWGLRVHAITGPCTDTPTLQQRTQVICGVPAMNMAHRGPT
jgi:hypothetical protein